ncbi:MFS transporter [Streptomyces asoensis]|uniref:MFS transporter n=1 Tax=Streptomyces asoensis TaxID=249586 RepID=UPI0033208AE1
MPDLPTPKDAAEAALFSECWDAVLSYADLCTSGSTAANQLAREAFALGIREARAAEDAGARGVGRRSSRLPRIPLLLTAVRTTAAAWEARGLGHRLDPDLRLWLNSDKAARYVGPPLSRPIALRGLRDMQEPDAALLWLAEVEALPLHAVIRRQGLDPAAAVEELNQVRGLFRDRCHRNHLDTPMDAECRSYVRLLDAVTRSPAADTPPDLSRHLATCVECAEAAACLRLHGGGLPAALAQGVIGWGGLAYLERRRRASEVRLGGGRPELPDAQGAAERSAAGRARVQAGPTARSRRPTQPWNRDDRNSRSGTPAEAAKPPVTRGRRHRHLPLVLVLGSLTALGPLTVDLYLPALPEVRADLYVSPAVTQLTLTAFMIGIALGQLVIGPLSDALGRRRPLLTGLSVYGVASALCALAQDPAVLTGSLGFAALFAYIAGSSFTLQGSTAPPRRRTACSSASTRSAWSPPGSSTANSCSAAFPRTVCWPPAWPSSPPQA